MIDITAFGGATVLTFITVPVADYLLASRKWRTAVFVNAAVVSGAVASAILKTIYVRPGP